MPRTKQFDEKEVLKKAMELFWEKGFHATSIQDLVSHLGINRASLYDTFGGKDELFNTAFESYRHQAGDFLKTIFA
ncbi:MAG: helix-turn-helix domain-containing protein, partial [Bacteroidota bacterium]